MRKHCWSESLGSQLARWQHVIACPPPIAQRAKDWQMARHWYRTGAVDEYGPVWPKLQNPDVCQVMLGECIHIRSYQMICIDLHWSALICIDLYGSICVATTSFSFVHVFVFVFAINDEAVLCGHRGSAHILNVWLGQIIYPWATFHQLQNVCEWLLFRSVSALRQSPWKEPRLVLSLHLMSS